MQQREASFRCFCLFRADRQFTVEKLARDAMPNSNEPKSSASSDRNRGGRPPRRTNANVDTFIHRNRRVRVPKGYIAVGLITAAHGLRGEVKIELHTDFPERFAPDAVVYLDENLNEMTLEAARPHQGGMLLRFVGINSRADADSLRGAWIFVPEESAQELDDGTYFVHDIVGLTVETAEGEVLGKISDVLFTGANEVYIVQSTDDPPREILLPAIAEVISSVDLAAGRMVITPLPGLLDA